MIKRCVGKWEGVYGCEEILFVRADELNLQSVANLVTTSSLEINLTFDPTGIPSDKLNSRYIYAKVYHSGSPSALAIFGTISSSNLKLITHGLAQDAIFTIVYNPNMEVVLSDAVAASSVDSFATRVPPWQTNRWMTIFNTAEATLRTVVAGILGVAPASLTNDQIKAVIKTRVTDNAAAAGRIYQTAGFRQPNLEPRANQALSGTTEAVFAINVTDARNSSAPSGATREAIPLLGLGYGLIYINSNDVNDTIAEPLGSILDAVAHEMLHTIQFGYDIGYGATSSGFLESTAATYGTTIDHGNTTPQVRTGSATEIYKLSTYLGCENVGPASYAYANQDFFAYVARAYNSNSLAYIKDFFEQAKTDINTLVASGETAARLALSRETLRRALNKALDTKFSKSLPYLYFDFVKQRAMEHSASSQLRTGEINTSLTFYADLFHGTSVQRKNADPEGVLSTPLRDSFASYEPFSSMAVIITPSRAVTNGVDVQLTLSASPSADIKAIVYRAGEASGTEFTGPLRIRGFGKSAGDILTVLAANVDYTKKSTIAYELGPPSNNTIEATIVINGTSYPFVPKFIASGFGSFSGSVKRSGLPTFLASTGRLSEISSSALLSVLTDPTRISSPGAYAMNKAGKVFENSNGVASLVYNTPLITQADDGAQVVFSPTSGTITFISYTASLEGYLSGTFECTVAGSRETLSVPVPGTDSRETLIGTITGRFGVTLGTSLESP
ncbi:hypothetical protein HZB07_05180 [Candidatus Saganbacteria bacterium]|nr:hypothetical protein [Candidatus Saganbacteria bacterium]